MPTNEELEIKINELEKKLSEKDSEFKKLKTLLTTHTHGGSQTSGRLEPKNLIVGTFSPSTIIVGNGASGSFKSNGDAETITVVSGIITDIS